MDNSVLIKNIEFLCAKQGIKATPTCVNAGVGRNFVGDLRRGQVPSVEKVQMLAAALGVSTSELLGEKIRPVSELDTSLEVLLAGYSQTTIDLVGKILSLPPEQLQKALDYIDFLASRS